MRNKGFNQIGNSLTDFDIMIGIIVDNLVDICLDISTSMMMQIILDNNVAISIVIPHCYFLYLKWVTCSSSFTIVCSFPEEICSNIFQTWILRQRNTTDKFVADLQNTFPTFVYSNTIQLFTNYNSACCLRKILFYSNQLFLWKIKLLP